MVNGITLLTAMESSELFEAIIKTIGGKRLPSVLLAGLSPYEYEDYVLPGLIGYLAKRGIALRYQIADETLDMTRYWQSMKAHSDQQGAGSIILSIWGKYDHWTCVQKITERSMMLIDSAAMRRIHRTSVTLDPQHPRRHLLYPRSTYLLSIDH